MTARMSSTSASTGLKLVMGALSLTAGWLLRMRQRHFYFRFHQHRYHNTIACRRASPATAGVVEKSNIAQPAFKRTQELGVNSAVNVPVRTAVEKTTGVQSGLFNKSRKGKTSTPASTTSAHATQKGFTMVAQRVNSASLLIDNKDTWQSINRGLVFHVSFAQGATSATVHTAAKTMLSLPIMTSGEWGDGEKPESILQRFKYCPCLVVGKPPSASSQSKPSDEQHNGDVISAMNISDTNSNVAGKNTNTNININVTQPGQDGRKDEEGLTAVSVVTAAAVTGRERGKIVSADNKPSFKWTHEGHIHLMVVPQASLSGRLKNGKVIQYHDQLPKEEGRSLYIQLLAELEKQAGDVALNNVFRAQEQRKYYQRSQLRVTRGDGKSIMTFDKRGIPTSCSNGTPHDKASKKVLERKFALGRKWVSSATASAKQDWDIIMQQRLTANHPTSSSSSSSCRRPPKSEPNANTSNPNIPGNIDANTNINTGVNPGEGGGLSTLVIDEATRHSPIRLVAGTYGNRQGLKLEAELGPFTHVFSL